LSAVLTVGCLIRGCHGVFVTRNVADVADWDTEHAGVCPAPEPQPLADLRAKLYDLEECDDPDYQDWKHRIDTEVMPLITVAAHLMVADTRTATGETQ
jgi:hypothetical protein